MEFSDLQKVWDSQNNQHMYTIDQSVLERTVHEKAGKIDRTLNVNEKGYIFISCFVTIVLLLIDASNVFNYITGGVMLLIALLVYVSRQRRLSKQRGFHHNTLGRLNAAIKNYQYYDRNTKYMPFWYIIPVAIPTLMNMGLSGKNPEIWQWAFVIGSFILGTVVTLRGRNKRISPQLAKLLELRKKLMEN